MIFAQLTRPQEQPTRRRCVNRLQRYRKPLIL